MQLSSVKYPAIHAKLNGMYAKKPKKTNLEELIKQNTTTQAIALLKNWNEDLKNLEDNPKRVKIKMQLDDILMKDIKKIYRLLNQKDKVVFAQFVSIYEIKCIKSVFRKLSSKSVMNEQTNEVENWIDNIFTNLKGLQNVKDYEEFLNVLKKTPYATIFMKCGEAIEEINIFEIENKLDKLYFEKMMKIARKYHSNLEDMIGKQIDLNNIIWIYRVKKNYHFSKEEVENILIHIHYKLKKSELEKLVEAKDEKEIKEILQKTFYGKYIDFNNLDALEENVDKYLYHVYQKYFRGNIFDVSSVYAYLGILEKENNDIMNIVEGIRYHLDKEEIRQKLV